MRSVRQELGNRRLRRRLDLDRSLGALDRRRADDPTLLMDLASVTKVYTSTLVLRLAELGVLGSKDSPADAVGSRMP